MADQLIRIERIVGNPSKGVTGILPISRSGWWEGVRTGRFPAAIKLSSRVTCWKLSEIEDLVRFGPM